MNILFHATYSNQLEFLNILKKKFKNHNIYTIKDNLDYNKIEVALLWNLPTGVLGKLKNLKVIFSIGAGVDHILKLNDFNNTPIIRVKDPIMRERMFNHVISQVLIYQLKLHSYQKAQQKKIWLNERYTPLNKELTIGILGLGYIGSFVAKKLQKLDYNILGYKNSKSLSNMPFKVFTLKSIKKFISQSDILISILPSTDKTENIINKNFLKNLKKKCLLINIGRGSSLNEEDLLNHLQSNPNFYVSLDVFKSEPLAKSHKFWSHPNITITPHIAAITDIESSINFLYSKFQIFKKKGWIKSDVNLKKGY